MSADSKCSDDFNGFLTKCQKIFRLENGALLGTAGDGDCRDVLTLLGRSKCTTRTTFMPTRDQLGQTKTEFAGLLAFPNGKLFTIFIYPRNLGTSDSEWTGEVIEMEEGFAAVGSGAPYALGAMKQGASAAQACNIACYYDNNCGLPIRSEQVKKVTK